MIEPIRVLSSVQPVHYVLADVRALAIVGESTDYFPHVALLFAIGLGAMLITYAKRSVER